MHFSPQISILDCETNQRVSLEQKSYIKYLGVLIDQTHCKQKPLSSSGDHAPTEWLTLGQSKTRTILNISLAY